MCKYREGGDIIRVELIGGKNITLETEDEGIFYIICDNEIQKQSLIDLVVEQMREKNKKVDVLDLDKVDSNLSVKDYLIFYAMITGIYQDNTVEIVIELLAQNNMKLVINKSVSGLTNVEKIKVRSIAAYLKEINCLVGKNILADLNTDQQEKIMLFLKKYFKKKSCICLLFESKEPQVIKDISKILKT